MEKLKHTKITFFHGRIFRHCQDITRNCIKVTDLSIEYMIRDTATQSCRVSKQKWPTSSEEGIGSCEKKKHKGSTIIGCESKNITKPVKILTPTSNEEESN